MAEFNWAIQAGTTVTYQDRFGDHLVEKVDAFFTLHCVDGYRARIADGPVWTDLLVQAGIARHTRLLE
jgi:hypothetical protein